MPKNDNAGGSLRNSASQGDSIDNLRGGKDSGAVDYYQVDQLSIEIIPAELGLGESKYPQKWLFTILNKPDCASDSVGARSWYAPCMCRRAL